MKVIEKNNAEHYRGGENCLVISEPISDGNRINGGQGVAGGGGFRKHYSDSSKGSGMSKTTTSMRRSAFSLART
jgi:hypothetical protein